MEDQLQLQAATALSLGICGGALCGGGIGGHMASSSSSTVTRYYRKETNGEKFPLPDEGEMLARNLERNRYHCKCAKKYSQARQIDVRPRTHDGDFLHGIAVKMQSARGAPVRNRPRVKR